MSGASTRRLLDRIEREAWALHHADAQVRDLRYGRVLGLLEAGTIAGLWSPKVARGAAASFAERVAPTNAMRRLRREAARRS